MSIFLRLRAEPAEDREDEERRRLIEEGLGLRKPSKDSASLVPARAFFLARLDAEPMATSFDQHLLTFLQSLELHFEWCAGLREMRGAFWSLVEQEAFVSSTIFV